MVDFYDSFTGTENTDLTDHVPDIGTGWTGGGASDNAKINANNQLKATSSDTVHVILADDVGGDHQIWFLMPAATSSGRTNNSRVCARLQDTNGYAGGFTRGGSNNTGEVLEATSRSGGSTTILAEHNQGTEADIYCRIKCDGTEVTFWHADTLPADPETDAGWTLLHTATDNTFTSVGTSGFLLFGSTASFTDSDPWVDDYNVASLTATPTITDINTTNEVVPGTTATLTGTNLTGATGFNIGSEAQTNFTVVSDTSITFTAVRGGNPYNQNLTGTLLHPDGNQTITVQQVPQSGTFAVTAASPNTTDDASLWTGLTDTATSNPITIVDGDQAWVKNPNNLTNLAIQPDGTITADQTGDFVVQIWLASEGVWGGDQTVTFTLPEEAADNWPFSKAITYAAPKTWTWGKRHPKTGMRVRIYE